jgi:hypothetical protein
LISAVFLSPDFSCRSHRSSHHSFAHEKSGLDWLNAHVVSTVPGQPLVSCDFDLVPRHILTDIGAGVATVS